MQSIQNAPTRPTLADALAARPSSAPQPALGSDPAGFASLLRQSRPDRPTDAKPLPRSEPPQAEGDAAPHDAAGDAANAVEQPTRAPGAAPPKPRTEKLATAPRHNGTAGVPPTPKPADTKKESAASPDPAAPPAVDPSLLWATAPRTLPPVDAGDGGVAAAPDPASTRLPGSASTRPATSPDDVDLLAAQPSAAATASRAAASADAAGGAGRTDAHAFAAQLDAAKPAQALQPPPADTALRAGDSAAAASAAAAANAFAAAPPTGAADIATLAVALATPVDAPEFAHELGLKLSVLARDGVQHAELHLNPAEMGPVSIRIVMDGSQARIDFGADLAATRQAIEAGLPALASALRDAGFTLAGGGVSQHAGSRGDGGDKGRGGTDERARRVTGAALDETLAVARRTAHVRSTAGRLDLYA